MSETASASAVSELPLAARVRLAHAMADHLLSRAGVRVLHHKGYAAAPGVYTAQRQSTDVDLLVAPEDQDRAIEALRTSGWTLVTGYAEGSIFRHAACLWHEHLGYVDIHRRLPGFTAEPREVFEQMWSQRSRGVLAARSCPVPSVDDQRLVVLIHAARDPVRGDRDAAHLREVLCAADWERLRRRARQFGAESAWYVSTGEDLGADPQEAALWQAVRDDVDSAALLQARLRAADPGLDRLRVLGGALRVNRGHLRMRLGREPQLRDVWADYRRRAAAGLRLLRGKAGQVRQAGRRTLR